MASATVYDICKRAGVSTATVSRVLNGTGKVSEKAKLKVQQAAKDLHYFPSFGARSLAKKRSDLLGAVFPKMASGFFADVLCGLDAAATDAGLHLVTAFSHGNEDECALAERLVGQRLVGGLIFMNFQMNESFLGEVHRRGVPVVSLDGSSTEVSSASIDNGSGMHEILQHIASLGHKRIALLLGDSNTYDAVQRLSAALKLADELGLEAPGSWRRPGHFSEAGGYEAVRELWQEGHHPTAIIAFNDLMALGAIRALRDLGLRVPEDVSVTGFDDIELATPYQLTTVRVEMFDLGKAAGELAVAQLNGQKEIQHRFIHPKLVVRNTCCPPLADVRP